MRFSRRVVVQAFVAAMALLLPLAQAGCQTEKRNSDPQATSQADDRGERPADVMAESDAERAKQAVRENAREGERRPAVPDHPGGRSSPVDQPRVGG